MALRTRGALRAGSVLRPLLLGPLLLGPFLLGLLLLSAVPARAQLLPGSGEATPDSIAQRLGLPEGHAPSKALRRALMVPGWGQYYNRQYWKMPLVAAGLGGVVFGLVYSWDQYLLYRNAWRYRRLAGGAFVPPAEAYDGEYGGAKYEAAYTTLLAKVGGSPGEELPQSVKSRREKFHHWGELSIIGTGVFWILQVADAYISAHLLGFSLEGDAAKAMSVKVLPRRQGVTAQLRVSF